VNLGCIELHPHPVRSADLDHPDELRVDLDPGPGVDWKNVRLVAREVQALLEEMGIAWLAQDEWFARHARQCADRAALEF
jgi:DNA primase